MLRKIPSKFQVFCQFCQTNGSQSKKKYYVYDHISPGIFQDFPRILWDFHGFPSFSPGPLGPGTQVAVMDPETAGLNDLAEIVARERSSAGKKTHHGSMDLRMERW